MNIFDLFWGLADFNKQNVLFHEAVDCKIVERKRPTNEKVHQESLVLDTCYVLETEKFPFVKKNFWIHLKLAKDA